MNKPLAFATFVLLGSLTVWAQGSGQGRGSGRGPAPSSHPPVTNPGSLHSNAPAGTPAAAADRVHGRERAEDVGKGKKKGLEKIEDHKKKEHKSER